MRGQNVLGGNSSLSGYAPPQGGSRASEGPAGGLTLAYQQESLEGILERVTAINADMQSALRRYEGIRDNLRAEVERRGLTVPEEIER